MIIADGPAANLVERTRDFAVRVIRMADTLPNKRSADVIARQVLKSGTSVGAHFREAMRARSKAEYTSKLNGGLMELEETLYWLEVLEASGLLPASRLSALRHEGEELAAIFVSLIKRWRPRQR